MTKAEEFDFYCMGALSTLAGSASDEAISKELSDLFVHKTLESVPDEEQPYIRKVLDSEKKAFRMLGEEAYFDSKTTAGKIALYRKGLDQLENELDDIPERITFGEFRKWLADAMSEKREARR